MPKTTKLIDSTDTSLLSKKVFPISKLEIDILTIVIGPEHHDIRLLDIQVLNILIFKMQFIYFLLIIGVYYFRIKIK